VVVSDGVRNCPSYVMDSGQIPYHSLSPVSVTGESCRKITDDGRTPRTKHL
jgi:hypothetical protein